MRSLFVLFLLAASPAWAAHPIANNTNAFDVLHAAGRIGVTVTGIGGHEGESVKVEVKNRSHESISTNIPTGWVFVSEDTTTQDMLVVREEVIALAPGATRTVTCRAFCCEGNMGGPREGEGFAIGEQGNDALTQLAQFIAQGSYPDDAVQNAVWSVSDGHPISAIHADLMASVAPLREQVARLTGRTVPWYSTDFAPPRDGRMCSSEPTRITGVVEYQVRHNAQLTVLLRDNAGHSLRTLSSHSYVGPGKFTMDVVLTVQGLPKGLYTIAFLHDGVLVKEIGFEL